jgi:hypothetical protein
MNSFVRTIAFGLAALCLLLLASGITVLVVLKRDGALAPQALRNLVLSSTEKDYLEGMKHRAQESSDAPVQDAHTQANEDEILAELADMANASHVTQLVTKLHRQQQDLDDRQSYLDQKWADLQLAKAGLERMQRQLKEEQQNDQDLSKQEADRERDWAAAQAMQTMHVQSMSVIEKARYSEQAKLFEAMKDAAWQSLRRMPPAEIARYLKLMSEKKAARMLVLAQQDSDAPNLEGEIQKEMLKVDLDGISGDQSERLATIYAYMPADQILPYLKDSSVQEVASIVGAMTRAGKIKIASEVMEALRKQDSNREMDVRHALEQGNPTVAGTNDSAPAASATPPTPPSAPPISGTKATAP